MKRATFPLWDCLRELPFRMVTFKGRFLLGESRISADYKLSPRQVQLPAFDDQVRSRIFPADVSRRHWSDFLRRDKLLWKRPIVLGYAVLILASWKTQLLGLTVGDLKFHFAGHAGTNVDVGITPGAGQTRSRR